MSTLISIDDLPTNGPTGGETSESPVHRVSSLSSSARDARMCPCICIYVLGVWQEPLKGLGLELMNRRIDELRSPYIGD